jgi:hypothetical protein
MIRAAYAITNLLAAITTNDSGKSINTTVDTPVFSAVAASTT